MLFRRENFKLNLKLESIPTPQMSTENHPGNVVLIRRVEILAHVQMACHLRICQHVGANSLHSLSVLRWRSSRLLSANTWEVRGHLTHGTD